MYLNFDNFRHFNAIFFLTRILFFTQQHSRTLGTEGSFPCDIFDEECQQNQKFRSHSQTRRETAKPCKNFQDIWLLPGRADSSCTRPGAKKLVEVDPRFVTIRPPVLKFPGCFTVEVKNIRINDNDDILKNSLFGKAEYQWLNVKEFGDVQCQNASANGCGGYGNNCYYCDICESLQEFEKSSTPKSFAEQFRGLSCPRKPGYYTFRKEFCFNDWSSFDTDGDCRIDFLESDQKSDIKSALSSLQQVGYGTIVAKIRLAYNATAAIERKKALKETQIERAVQRELAERRRSWDISDAQFERFRRWYTAYRRDVWHRDEYLPWLLYENEISCLRLTFNICERQPRPRQIGASAQGGYICD